MDHLIVGKPTLPDINKFLPHLHKIWDSKALTNNGKYLQEFEKKLADFLDVKAVVVFCNATIALISLIKCLEIKGKIITSPFSFVATGNVILLSGLKPEFVDISNKNYNLDPKKLENFSYKDVSAIMPVHVFSKPAFVDDFKNIGLKENIKIIYDGSHAFGSKYKNKSVLSFGNASVVSFHATKILTTLEGGAIITENKDLAQRLTDFRNFGISQSGYVNQIGLNGKLNEIQAAIGILQLDEIKGNLLKRKEIGLYYRKYLKDIAFLKLPSLIKYHEDNYSYFPVEVINTNKYNREYINNILLKNNIFCKNYFDPIITNQPIYKKISNQNTCLMNAEKISKKIICLPIYPEMSLKDVDYILKVLKSIEN